jgi:hypothetical protein
MPDIKSALAEALAKTAQAWAADDEAHQKIEPQQEKAMENTADKPDGRIKTNVSRVTFYFIRDHAGMTSEQVVNKLLEQGFKATTVTTLIGQMLRMRMIMADEQGRLSAVVREYIPIQAKGPKPAAKKPTRVPRPEVSYERKQVTLVNTRTGEVLNPKPAPAGIAALATTATYPTPPEWTVESVIGSLNVRQAMAVYSELRGIFGA